MKIFFISSILIFLSPGLQTKELSKNNLNANTNLKTSEINRKPSSAAFIIQLGAFSKAENASLYAKNLKNQSINAYVESDYTKLFKVKWSTNDHLDFQAMESLLRLKKINFFRLK
ncbi:MAG: SPOR domain-containing protein [Bdellovibrionales bacterium]